MRWKRGHTSGIEDRRAQGGSGGFSMAGRGAGGGGIPLPAGLGGGGILVVLILVFAMQFLGGGSSGSIGTGLDGLSGAANQPTASCSRMSTRRPSIGFSPNWRIPGEDVRRPRISRFGQLYHAASCPATVGM